jgi:hypothetical protein
MCLATTTKTSAGMLKRICLTLCCLPDGCGYLSYLTCIATGKIQGSLSPPTTRSMCMKYVSISIPQALAGAAVGRARALHGGRGAGHLAPCSLATCSRVFDALGALSRQPGSLLHSASCSLAVGNIRPTNWSYLSLQTSLQTAAYSLLSVTRWPGRRHVPKASAYLQTTGFGTCCSMDVSPSSD